MLLLLLRRERDRQVRVRLRMRDARPMARGRKRLRVGPSSAVTDKIRRSSPSSSWLCSALATAELEQLLPVLGDRARRVREDRARLRRPTCRGCGRRPAAPCGRTCGRTWRGRVTTGRRRSARRRGLAAGFGAPRPAGSSAFGARRGGLRAALALGGLGLGLGACGLLGGASASSAGGLSASAAASARRLDRGLLERSSRRRPRSSASRRLLGSSRRPGSSPLPGVGVAAVGARRRELAELVADHRLASRTRARACARRGRRWCGRPSRGRSSTSATRCVTICLVLDSFISSMRAIRRSSTNGPFLLERLIGF